jgi:hypothetical protein
VRMVPIRCPETSVNSYHTMPCNNPEERRSHQHRGGSLKSKYYLGDQIKKNEVGGSCSLNGTKEKCIQYIGGYT